MNNSYTQQMESALFEQWIEFDDYDEDYSSLIEKLNSVTTFRTFGDGLLFFLQKKNPELTAESAIKYIEKICKDTCISTKDIASTNTLTNWFKGGPRPKKGEDSRRSMFALSFSLQLTPYETSKLFHKVYLDRAFDYRNTDEVIYYFCLNNKKTWTDANRLISMIKDSDICVNDNTIYTAQIKNDIETLKDEEALIAYLSDHGNNFAKKNITAIKVMKRLLAEANEKANEESEVEEYVDRFRGYDKTSNNFTYEVITNLRVNGDKGTKTLFKNARLPKEIKNRFPEAITISKKDHTYEELRKLIILLFSYCYWYDVQQKNKAVELDDYISEINVHLYESGFSLMYYGNPFDWMFLYCAISDSPIDTFRGLLADVLVD